MLVSVLINNYNYAPYLSECIDSVLNQTYQNFELIVVDDGSADNSYNILDQYHSEKIKIIKKTNGGQLSAFNAGFLACKGEIIFFLDSDDYYFPNYLETAVNFYKQHSDADSLYVAMQHIGNGTGSNNVITGSLGYTLCKTYFLRSWYGVPTSAISLRKTTLEKILPLDLEQDWRIRADDCIVIGISLVGGKKYSLNNKLVAYRIHNNNNYYGKTNMNRDIEFKRYIALNKLFNTILEKNHITITGEIIYYEFINSPNKTLSLLFNYIKILWKLNHSLVSNCWGTYLLIKYYLKRNKLNYLE